LRFPKESLHFYSPAQRQKASHHAGRFTVTKKIWRERLSVAIDICGPFILAVKGRSPKPRRFIERLSLDLGELLGLNFF
jgi:hypothetical protein